VVNTSDMRLAFAKIFDPTKDMVELIGASHEVTEPSIFGETDPDYIARELQWYDSQSLSVERFPGGAPTGWQAVAGGGGRINSNYGHLLYSEANGYQFSHVVDWLLREGDYGRRATAVYTRPSIHEDATADGMNDFICTNAVEYFWRDGAVDAVVQMRSNDVIWGYRNDVAWQQEVLRRVVDELSYRGRRAEEGRLYWQTGSLHIYPRHYKKVMREILWHALEAPARERTSGQLHHCSRKKVAAWFGPWPELRQFNGGPMPCLRETPGHVLRSDYSDCPYPHAEIRLLEAQPFATNIMWVTSPPCLPCCEKIVERGVETVIAGYRSEVDGHLPISEIREVLGERLHLVDLGNKSPAPMAED